MDILSGSRGTKIHSSGEMQLARDPLCLFVGAIPEQLKESHLRCYFTRLGCIHVSKIARPANNRNRGHAYIRFPSSNLVDNVLRSTPTELFVRGAKLRIERAIDAGIRRNLQKSLGERRLYLSGIPASVTSEELCKSINNFGVIQCITKLRRSHPFTTPPSFYCYVTMDRREDAESLIEKQVLEIDHGIQISIKHFLAHSQRFTGKNILNSTISRGLVSNTDQDSSQRGIYNMGTGAIRIQGQESIKSFQTGFDSSIPLTQSTMACKLQPSPVFSYRIVGKLQEINLHHESLGIQNKQGFFNNQYVKIRQSLSISQIPNIHDRQYSANLRLNVQRH